MTGLVTQMLDDENLQQGNALNGLAESGGGIVGPALAGVIVATSSPGWAVLVDAFTYLISVGSLAMVRVNWKVVRPSESFFVLLAQGWQEFWSRTWLWAVVVASSLFNLIVFAPYLVLGPVVAKDHLGGAASWGIVLASLGVGALVGGIILLRVHPRRPLFVGLVTSFVWAIPLLAMALRPSTALIAIGSFLGGGSMSVFNALWNTTVQREVPTEVLSRVSAYDWFGSLAFLPIGMALVGPLAIEFGDTAVLAAAGLLTVVLTVAVLSIPSVSGLRSPESD
jgi:MFS family permease